MINFTLDVSSIIIKLLAAVVVLLIGFIVARILSKLTKRILNELEIDKVLKEQTNIKTPLEEFLSSTVKYLVYFIAVIIALNQLGLTTTVLQIILFSLLAILVGFIILAFKDFIPNIVAGFFIHQKAKIKPGDKIIVKDIQGQVIHVDLTETRIRTKKKDIVFVPNSLLMKNEITKLKKN
tara:strand:- start:29140 stop:29679 length:540 start_codon:yes stop_codon:yes gene_type:complete